MDNYDNNDVVEASIVSEEPLLRNTELSVKRYIGSDYSIYIVWTTFSLCMLADDSDAIFLGTLYSIICLMSSATCVSRKNLYQRYARHTSNPSCNNAFNRCYNNTFSLCMMPVVLFGQMVGFALWSCAFLAAIQGGTFAKKKSGTHIIQFIPFSIMMSLIPFCTIYSVLNIYAWLCCKKTHAVELAPQHQSSGGEVELLPMATMVVAGDEQQTSLADSPLPSPSAPPMPSSKDGDNTSAHIYAPCHDDACYGDI